jgi:hypothetical protein
MNYEFSKINKHTYTDSMTSLCKSLHIKQCRSQIKNPKIWLNKGLQDILFKHKLFIHRIFSLSFMIFQSPYFAENIKLHMCSLLVNDPCPLFGLVQASNGLEN